MLEFVNTLSSAQAIAGSLLSFQRVSEFVEDGAAFALRKGINGSFWHGTSKLASRLQFSPATQSLVGLFGLPATVWQAGQSIRKLADGKSQDRFIDFSNIAGLAFMIGTMVLFRLVSRAGIALTRQALLNRCRLGLWGVNLALDCTNIVHLREAGAGRRDILIRLWFMAAFNFDRGSRLAIRTDSEYVARMQMREYEKRYRAVYDSGGDRFYPPNPSLDLIRYLDGYGDKPGRVLITGCGEGRNIQPFLERGWKVVGADSAPSAIERASKDFGSNPFVELRVGDARKLLVYPPESFELVVSVQLLHLMIRPQERLTYFREMYRLLPSGGRFYLEHNGKLNAARVEFLKGGHLESRTVQGPNSAQKILLPRLPTVMLNGKTLREELEGSGFIVDSMTAGEFQHPDTLRPQIITHARRL